MSSDEPVSLALYLGTGYLQPLPVLPGCRHGGTVHDAECSAPASVPVSVLEALAGEWQQAARQARDNEWAAMRQGGDGARRSHLYQERAIALEDCTRELREAMARSGQE